MMKSLLGPKSKDKLMVDIKGNVTHSNDGAFILQSIQFSHPISKLLIELSTCMDDEIGDGTTSVIVLVGALLGIS
jgi:chaperonin GroEL (HSP60 family)